MAIHEAPIKVNVFAHPNGTHVHQILAGLYELEYLNDITLRFIGKRCDWSGVCLTRQIVHIEIERPEKGGSAPIRIVFDLNDSPEIADSYALECSQYYVKRSFCDDVVRDFPNIIRKKIIPFGFNYQVLSRYQRNVVFRLMCGFILFPFNPVDKKNRPHVSNLAHWVLDSYFPNSNRRQLFFIDEFEKSPTSYCDERIFFQCRLWDPSWFSEASRDHIESLNVMRISLLEQLKKNFGARFEGGLQYNEYSERVAPKLISDSPTNRGFYLDRLHKSSIAIATNGIDNSIGWKVGEYIAAARCIVSEPLAYKVPGGFKKGVNYLSFSNPDECLARCDFLLRNPRASLTMRSQNHQYYKRYLAPGALMRNILFN